MWVGNVGMIVAAYLKLIAEALDANSKVITVTIIIIIHYHHYSYGSDTNDGNYNNNDNGYYYHCDYSFC